MRRRKRCDQPDKILARSPALVDPRETTSNHRIGSVLRRAEIEPEDKRVRETSELFSDRLCHELKRRTKDRKHKTVDETALVEQNNFLI
jgi:hypothetical protein